MKWFVVSCLMHGSAIAYFILSTKHISQAPIRVFVERVPISVVGLVDTKQPSTHLKSLATPVVVKQKKFFKKSLQLDPVSEKEQKNPENKPEHVVGLDASSMAQTPQLDAPSFAIGNTRMGETSEIAKDAAKVEALPSLQNTVSTYVPAYGAHLERPKRKVAQTPLYPEFLRNQNIEGDVVVRLVLNEAGHVTDARVVQSSGYDAFDRAALDAAQKEQFEPAKRDGIAVSYTLQFSYRFRLDDL